MRHITIQEPRWGAGPDARMRELIVFSGRCRKEGKCRSETDKRRWPTEDTLSNQLPQWGIGASSPGETGK